MTANPIATKSEFFLISLNELIIEVAAWLKYKRKGCLPNAKVIKLSYSTCFRVPWGTILLS